MRFQPFKGRVGKTVAESEPWWPAVPAAAPGSPSVVMIVLDDVGFAQLGCYGSNIRTPSVDRLSEQGLRYTNFHTTSLCSPTRACLLTGRNHHSVGIATIANFDSGFPNGGGAITHRAATMAEILRGEGYNTLAVGKWHLTPTYQQSPAGPYDQWPLQRGFERFYGFLPAETNQWCPGLTCDNQAIEAPQRPGYHLTEDLVDKSIEYLRNQISWAPDKPFFLYLAFGACHDPHQAPAEFIDGYRGEFDEGWDVCREQWLARQKELGIVPPETVLPSRNPGVDAWSSLSGDERLLATRLQEAFAGMLEHADHHIGRLVDFLERMGRRENTMIIVVSDNGASQEGSAIGTVNAMRYHNGLEDTVEGNLAEIDLIGTSRGANNYPHGWAMAGNTPGKWYKQNTHGGGIRDPFIISWPKGIEEPGGIRTQFHHATDVVPTVLEVAGIEEPSTLSGVDQIPIEGVSMRYSFDQPDQPSRKRVQHFEILGNRAIYADGWKAVTRHEPNDPFDADCWELYHLESDFSESRDLASEHPERLRSLIDLWWAEAGRYQVLPLDDRRSDMWNEAVRPGSFNNRSSYRLYRGIDHIGPDASPNLRDISHSITVVLDRDPEDEGVLVAHGGFHGGYSLFVKDGLLHYHYNCAGTPYRVSSDSPLPTGTCTVRMDFTKTGRCAGRVELSVDGRAAGSSEIATLPYYLSAEGFDVGEDRMTPVADYESPFRFSGDFDHVLIEVGDNRDDDAAAELESTIGRQ